jgi:hypothetical protein
MNRSLKDPTVKRYYYATHDELRTHLRDFVSAYNFARRLKTLKGRFRPHQKPTTCFIATASILTAGIAGRKQSPD